MEKLIGTDEKGVYLKKCLECSGFGKCSSCIHKYRAFERLSEYESLGITPEQVKEMDELYKKKCEEVSKNVENIVQQLEREKTSIDAECNYGYRIGIAKAIEIVRSGETWKD